MGENIDIFVLDDSSLALKMLEKMLSRYNLSIHLETDAIKALETISLKKPRLIFIDYLMPELSGADVAIKFSELKLFKECSLVLLSGKEFDSNETYSMMSLGYEYILKKPISKEKLHEVLISYFPSIHKSVS